MAAVPQFGALAHPIRVRILDQVPMDPRRLSLGHVECSCANLVHLHQVASGVLGGRQALRGDRLVHAPKPVAADSVGQPRDTQRRRVRLVELLRAVEGSVVEVVERVIYSGTVREIDGPSRCGRALGVIVPRNAHGVEAEQVERAEVPQDHVPIAAPCALHIDPLARQHGTGALHAWIEAPARRVQVIVGERWVAHARAGDARVGHVVLLMQPIVDLPGGRVADHQQRMRAEPLQHLSELGSHWR